MASSNKDIKEIINKGIKAGDSKMSHEDKIWSKYSNDKVNIGETLSKVIRVLSKALALNKKLFAMSIGSSNEPQFRILETCFRAGLYLLDIEKEALLIIKERIKRQYTDHVTVILNDYRKILLSKKETENFFNNSLGKNKMDLVTLHHSLYYSRTEEWEKIFVNIYEKIMSSKSALHAVLMSSETKEKNTTTWLYNHFAGKYFNHTNSQSLLELKKILLKNKVFKSAQIFSKTSCVNFFSDDFEKFMSVIWMILLYPNVHKYTFEQRKEITEYVYNNIWSKQIPLKQMQDHIVIYKGISFKGLV